MKQNIPIPILEWANKLVAYSVVLESPHQTPRNNIMSLYMEMMAKLTTFGIAVQPPQSIGKPGTSTQEKTYIFTGRDIHFTISTKSEHVLGLLSDL